MTILSYASRADGNHTDSDAPQVEEDSLKTIADQVRSAFAPPAPPRDFDLDQIREFLDLVTKVAIEAGIEDEAELEAVVGEAARMYVARSVQDQVSDVLRLTFELPTTPVRRGAAAFFRRFAER